MMTASTDNKIFDEIFLVKKANNSLINYRSIAVTICQYTYNNKQVCKVLRKNSHLKFRLSGMCKFLQQTAQKQLLSPRRGIRYNKIPIPQKGGGE